MDAFPLPCLTLTHGDWSCLIADPRDNPLALGSRFIHGGYIAQLSLNNRELTNRAISHWDPYYGQGLPEAFDEPLGFAAAANGEAYLRIGSGRCLRMNADRHGQSELHGGVAWTLLEQGSNHCAWRCSDELEIGGERYAYQLERRVVLHDDGLSSASTLTIDCPWSEPLTWFPHTYFKQSRGSGCSVHLPAHCSVNNQQLGSDIWRGEDAAVSFAVVSGLWGSQQGTVVDLDPSSGGGSVDLRLDRPMDKLVLWANERSFAAEPYWSHAWANGETARWTLRYTFSP